MGIEATERSVHRGARLAPEAPVGHSTGWWGMVLFICTEAATFAAALASYFYLRFAHDAPWPPPADKRPDLVVPSIATGILVASVIPMFLAGRAARKERGGLTGLAVVVTLAGGAAFVALQIVDWLSEWPDSTLQKDAYGSLFYSVTGLHTLHVVVGLGMLVFLVVAALVGRVRRHHWEPVAIVALYWYFMAVLGVAVYLTVYISPYV